MVRIITDSAADFEPRELAEKNIHCIPIKVMLGDKEYEENINLSKDQFYELLASTGCTPKTSQPSPQILMDLFADAKKAGEEAVYISLSSALSGTYQSAVMTQEDFGSDSHLVLDSKNATGGQRLLVEYAVRLRDEGKSAGEIVEAVTAIRDKIVLYACIDTLEYLYKGGRISHTVYKLGTMAQVKPIIRVSQEGGIEVPAKAMVCARVWTTCASGWSSRNPARSTTCMLCTPPTASAARHWQKRFGSWALRFPRSGSSTWARESAATSAPMLAVLCTWKNKKDSLRCHCEPV